MRASALLIASPQNPRVKTVVSLRQRAHRDALGLMIIEGYREIKRALDNRHVPAALYTCPPFFLGSNEPALIERCRKAGVEILECTPPVFAKMSYRDRPEGLLAVAPQVRRSLADIRLPADPLLVVAEAIEKPGNLGTILRSADAAGVDAVIVCDPVTDLFNPNVVRSSTGVLFAMPVAIASSAEVHEFLRGRGIRVVATTPSATELYTRTDLTGPLALLMGSEQYGLSDFWLKEADSRIRIPMAGQADSLNVAMATIITLFEAVRQRGL
jgi:TrmH family RNA methyltransferase